MPTDHWVSSIKLTSTHKEMHKDAPNLKTLIIFRPTSLTCSKCHIQLNSDSRQNVLKMVDIIMRVHTGPRFNQEARNLNPTPSHMTR